MIMNHIQTLYFGGPILTMEDGPAPQAVLVREGRIARTGPLEELRAAAPGAKEENLRGRALLPAFLDPHSHITALAETLDLAQLGAAVTPEEIAVTLRDFAHERDLPPGEWAIGFGYDHNVLPGGAHPTRQDLDALLPDRPAMITHASGHMGVVNTAGLTALGITLDTPDPAGGRIGREADGKTPSGYLEEGAFFQASAVLPPTPPQVQMDRMRRAQAIYFSHGIVLAQDGLTDHSRYQLLQEAGLTIDTVGYADMRTCTDLAGKPGIGGYKILLDGSPQGRTAWMLDPYQGDSGEYRGYPIYTDEQVCAFVRQALTQGRQLLAHCNGDGAADQLLRCCRRVQEETGVPLSAIRPVMIHAQLVRRGQLEQMADLGMIPSFFAAHVWYWGDIHVKNFGLERASRISPLASARALGLPFTLHQDSPVIPPDMLQSVWCAVNRLTRSGRVLGPEERVDPRTALAAVTCNAARQYFMEGERGSIAPGKRADFVVLSADPTAVDPADIRNIRVLQTVKDGVRVWAAPRR